MVFRLDGCGTNKGVYENSDENADEGDLTNEVANHSQRIFTL